MCTRARAPTKFESSVQGGRQAFASALQKHKSAFGDRRYACLHTVLIHMCMRISAHVCNSRCMHTYVRIDIQIKSCTDR